MKEYTYDDFKKHMAEIDRYPYAAYADKELFLFFLRLKTLYGRYFGGFSFDDRIRLNCICTPPMVFLKWGCLICHPFGVTLCADEIGADCVFGQNTTIGTNSRYIPVGGNAEGHQPKIGNLIRVYSGAVISGKVTIGDRVIIAAQAFVDKDVPSDSIVYGVNQIKPLKPSHKTILQDVLWQAKHIDRHIPGLTYKNNKLYINEEWIDYRNKEGGKQ